MWSCCNRRKVRGTLFGTPCIMPGGNFRRKRSVCSMCPYEDSRSRDRCVEMNSSIICYAKSLYITIKGVHGTSSRDIGNVWGFFQKFIWCNSLYMICSFFFAYEVIFLEPLDAWCPSHEYANEGNPLFEEYWWGFKRVFRVIHTRAGHQYIRSWWSGALRPQTIFF